MDEKQRVTNVLNDMERFDDSSHMDYRKSALGCVVILGSLIITAACIITVVWLIVSNT